MYILVVYYLFKNASNSFANDCTAFFLNTYFPSCISTNFAARNNFKWWCTVDLLSCNLSVISCNVRSFSNNIFTMRNLASSQELYVFELKNSSVHMDLQDGYFRLQLDNEILSYLQHPPQYSTVCTLFAG